MAYHEFIYIGEPIPTITEQEFPEFYLEYQKAILSSLKKRKLLTDIQYNYCIEKLERHYYVN